MSRESAKTHYRSEAINAACAPEGATICALHDPSYGLFKAGDKEGIDAQTERLRQNAAARKVIRVDATACQGCCTIVEPFRRLEEIVRRPLPEALHNEVNHKRMCF